MLDKSMWYDMEKSSVLSYGETQYSTLGDNKEIVYCAQLNSYQWPTTNSQFKTNSQY